MSSRNTERDDSKDTRRPSWMSKLTRGRSDSQGKGTNGQPTSISRQAASASGFLSAGSDNETVQSLVPTGYRSDVETVITAGGFDESVLNIPKVKPAGTWKDFVVSLIEENLGEDPLHSAYTVSLSAFDLQYSNSSRHAIDPLRHLLSFLLRNSFASNGAQSPKANRTPSCHPTQKESYFTLEGWLDTPCSHRSQGRTPPRISTMLRVDRSISQTRCLRYSKSLH